MSPFISEEKWKEIVPPDGFCGDVRFIEPMEGRTSLKIGGPADVFASPQDAISLRNMLAALKENNVPFIAVGGGTNLLVRDGGIDGVVISMKGFRRIGVLRDEGASVLLMVESGLPLPSLVNFTKENGYAGIEGLAGIPGLVGGAIAGNAGAFDYEMKDAVISVLLVRADGEVKEISAKELGFGYRSSKMPGGSVILGATLEMKKDSRENILRRIDGFMREKRRRQPLSELSAGCVFRNPEGQPAGKLVEDAGCKGMRIGDVEVSSVHANFFINMGAATASDFIRLMDEVRARVIKSSGIELVPEIRIVGRE